MSWSLVSLFYARTPLNARTDDAQHHLQLAFLAAAVLGTWDIIVTLNQERNLVWPRRISLVKVAYLLNRYYWLFGLVPLCGAAVFAHFSQSTCENGYWRVLSPVACDSR